ncbi:hypothetical protein CFC21_036900 [Triticum aestivum]|uniref:Photosystem II reaction center Psb28 protein n=4 Tax=Triticum TaxID=4564 RepID=A0A9R0RUL6_TRITD|nr:hypothetical protein CFC21_036900 [Triticum aestivum]VAH66280.1 unnamed protein product [Triticum turgidum subsp. durum]
MGSSVWDTQPPKHSIHSLPLPEQANCIMPAVMKALAAASPVSAPPSPRRSVAGSSGAPCQSLHSSFRGISLRCRPRKPAHRSPPLRSSRAAAQVVAMKPAIQFIQGTDEQTIPDVRLTKSRDGTNGVAIFEFDQPSVFDSSAELGDITGFYMIDEEGMLQTVDVSAKFVNGKPARVEAKYVMRTAGDWDRFMRFMERYSQANGLQFVKN